MSANSREPMRDSAFAWAIEQLPLLIDYCNRTQFSKSSHAEYHGMVDGIVWTDELPVVESEARGMMQQAFCVFVHLRTSVILGEELGEKAGELLDLLHRSCPNWSFVRSDRWASLRVKDYEEVRSKFYDRLDRLKSKASESAGQESGGDIAHARTD